MEDSYKEPLLAPMGDDDTFYDDSKQLEERKMDLQKYGWESKGFRIRFYVYFTSFALNCFAAQIIVSSSPQREMMKLSCRLKSYMIMCSLFYVLAGVGWALKQHKPIFFTVAAWNFFNCIQFLLLIMNQELTLAVFGSVFVAVLACSFCLACLRLSKKTNFVFALTSSMFIFMQTYCLFGPTSLFYSTAATFIVLQAFCFD